MAHRAGFVNIIGRPNAGKSTLMNAFVGERLSIITSKAQTTRHRIFGIVNTDDYQIVFSDTPGMLRPNYKLQESMMRFVEGALVDADILLAVTTVEEKALPDHDIVVKTSGKNIPLLLVINKIDLCTQEEAQKIIDTWKTLLPQAEIFPVSALHNFNLEGIMQRIVELLPESPPYYDKEALTDKPERFFVSEIIREKILENYSQEIPYAVEVVIESYVETEKLVRINAVIIVERDSQKGIIIGKQGTALKRTATQARKSIEKFLDKKVFLETYVKVDKDWRANENRLRNYGYLD